MNTRKISSGFTLIELMITVAVIGILSMVALPSYNEYIERSRRADAKSGLLSIQLQQESWRANNTLYTTAANLNMPSSDFYTFTIASYSKTNFIATAGPISGTSQENDTCGTFEINVNGPDDTGGNASVANCWNR